MNTNIETLKSLRDQVAQSGKDAMDAGNHAEVNRSVRAVRVLNRSIEQLDRIYAPKAEAPVAEPAPAPVKAPRKVNTAKAGASAQ